MNFNMNMRKILLTSAIAFSAASAFAADNQAEVVTQQKSLLEKLDSLSAAVLGLKINGTAKAGALASFSSSDQYTAESPTQENQAFTDVNLRLTARPSSETMVDVQLRLHKDWQSAYDENNNPVIGHWFSYDGTILNKHVDFNLGYMRVGYTPFTIYTPQTEILQEPEIFVEKRREALEKRNLDTTSRRLLQGLNVAYQSGSVGPVDNITAQLTGARLRNTAKKQDQVFFDFDWADRYAYGLRAGISTFGVNLGANYVGALDRRQTTRSRDLPSKDTIIYDDNSVFSAELGFDSQKLLSGLPVHFGLNGEYAMSWWNVDADVMKITNPVKHVLKEDGASGPLEGTIYMATSMQTVGDAAYGRFTEHFFDTKGTAFNVNPYVEGSFSGFSFKLNSKILQTRSQFCPEVFVK